LKDLAVNHYKSQKATLETEEKDVELLAQTVPLSKNAVHAGFT
jgi:hypothetical protein